MTLKGGHVVRTKWPIGESARRRSGQRLRAATLSVGQRARELQRLGRVAEAHRTPLSPFECMQNGSTTYIDVDDGQRDGQGTEGRNRELLMAACRLFAPPSTNGTESDDHKAAFTEERGSIDSETS